MHPQNAQDPREILASADRLRRTARAAEDIRVRIRLGEKPVATRGFLGFRKRDHEAYAPALTGDETAAVYDALADVRDRMQHNADVLEKTVTSREVTP